MLANLTQSIAFYPYKQRKHDRTPSINKVKHSNKKSKVTEKALSQTTQSKRTSSTRKSPQKQERKGKSHKGERGGGKEMFFMTNSLNLPRMASMSHS